MAGIMTIGSGERAPDANLAQLLTHGWKEVGEDAPCAKLDYGKYYEAEGASGNKEFYVTESGAVYAESKHWPGEIIACHQIPNPSFISEVP